jgi:hypothetical protein
MSDRPWGVAGVAVLTLLGGGCLFLYAIVVVALGAMGHAGTPTDLAAMLRLQSLVLPPLALSPLCVVAAVGILMRARFARHLSTLLWILSIAYLVYAAFAWLPLPAPTGYVPVAAAIVVNLIFLAYFQSEEVKRYFNPR